MIFFSFSNLSSYLKPLSNILWIALVVCVIITVNSCDTTKSVTPYQGQTFIKLYGGNGTEEGKDLVQLPDGGFVLVGSSTSESNGGKDVYVVRTDNIGNMIWEKTFGGEWDDIGNSVILGRNNSIYVCGETTRDNDTIDVYVLNIDINDGSTITEKLYGETNRDEIGKDIIELNNGGFFITATDLHPDTSNYFLIETESNLETLPGRSRYIGTQNVNNYSTSSFENENDLINPFICFGSVERTVDSTFWFRSFIYRSDGESANNPEYYGYENSDDICTDVYKTTDSGHILSGYTYTDESLKQEMVVKTDLNRLEVWKKVYSNEFNKSVGESGIIQTQDGGFILSTTIELDDPKNDEISLLKLNSEGEEEWRKTYGSDDDDVGSKVVQTDDGSFVVVGTIGFDINPDSRSKMCLIKVNPNGELIPIN